jgi:hypothetical protein
MHLAEILYEIKKAFRKGEKMAISINDYLESINAITAASQNVAAANNTVQADTVSSEKDSYIASEVNADSVLPSDNYNDILDVMRSAKAELNSSDDSDSDTDTASASGESSTEAVGSAGGSGGGGGSDSDEDETTTEIVTINGQTYLETTTTSNGITTVTRTKIGASEDDK